MYPHKVIMVIDISLSSNRNMIKFIIQSNTDCKNEIVVTAV